MVIVIIVMLIGILFVATSAARNSAKRSETRSRMNSMAQGTVMFQHDIGYLPPILNDARGLEDFPNWPPVGLQETQTCYRRTVQDWHSITSPAEYLLGYGGRNEDGYGSYRLLGGPLQLTDESPPLGIRHPSTDGVWGATDPYGGVGDGGVDGGWDLLDRAYAIGAGGKSYGPYIEIENEQMLGRIVLDSDGNAMVDPITREPAVFYPGDPEYDPESPMVLVDSWGSPIRYYRRVYPFRNQVRPPDPATYGMTESGIARVFPPTGEYGRPTLSDFILLRPFDYSDGYIYTKFYDYSQQGSAGDPTSTLNLETGTFAYFSPGADKHFNPFIRIDAFGKFSNSIANSIYEHGPTDEFNADNIVEVGP